MEIKVKVINDGKIISAQSGEKLLSVLADNGYFIPAFCGGRGDCGKCKVRIANGVVSGANPDASGMVLSCKAILTEDLTVEIPQTNGGGFDEFDYEEVESNRDGLGVVIDIGTTTVVAVLVDLKSGKCIKKVSGLNAQAPFGADVISRIDACANGKLDALNRLIVGQCSKFVNELLANKMAEEVVITANTTMLHLFLGVDPQSIGVSPFTPTFTDEKVFDGEKFGFPAKKVRLLPSVSGYIGADVVSGVLSCNVGNNDGQMLVDVGTNGEVVLFSNGKYYATSTAAGPAFEGACIECGSGGITGAISRVFKNATDLELNVIGGGKAKSICGSGLIDAVALLVEEGLIDETGAFDDECESALSNRLVDDKFYLTDEVYISQADIRQVQLAKSAVKSGIETLLFERQTSINAITTIFLAGGLGRFISEENAIKIGLLPQGFAGKIKVVGNSAVAGARLCLLDEKRSAMANKLSNEVEVVELANSQKFQTAFVDNMYFE